MACFSYVARDHQFQIFFMEKTTIINYHHSLQPFHQDIIYFIVSSSGSFSYHSLPEQGYKFRLFEGVLMSSIFGFVVFSLSYNLWCSGIVTNPTLWLTDNAGFLIQPPGCPSNRGARGEFGKHELILTVMALKVKSRSAYFLLQCLYFINKRTWFIFGIFVFKFSASKRFPVLPRYRCRFAMGADTSVSCLAPSQCWDFLCTGWSRCYHRAHLHFPWKYQSGKRSICKSEGVKPLFPSGFGMMHWMI